MADGIPTTALQHRAYLAYLEDCCRTLHSHFTSALLLLSYSHFANPTACPNILPAAQTITSADTVKWKSEASTLRGELNWMHRNNNNPISWNFCIKHLSVCFYIMNTLEKLAVEMGRAKPSAQRRWIALCLASVELVKKEDRKNGGKVWVLDWRRSQGVAPDMGGDGDVDGLMRRLMGLATGGTASEGAGAGVEE